MSLVTVLPSALVYVKVRLSPLVVAGIIINEKVPPTIGETTQLITMVPIFDQFTASIPIPTIANPTIAPMILCVVETGQPIQLATVNQSAAASRAESIPQTRISGFPRIGVGSMIPFLIVLVTLPLQ